MNKKTNNKFFTLFLIIFLLFVCNVKANITKRAYITATCNVRTGPGTQNNRLTSAYRGHIYNLVEDKVYKDTNNHKNCDGDWYQIYFNGVAKGYVCGDHVEVVSSYSEDGVEPVSDCEKEMSNLGFPSTYWGGLCQMKEKHPNWEFVPKVTNLKWQDVIESESPCGWNLIYGNAANEGFIDHTCKSYDSGYVGILPSGVAYYMDPRNFLSEATVFQFLSLNYDDRFKDNYVQGAKSIINGAMFYQYHLGLNTDLSVEINNVGKELNVSPIFTATRMFQELGSKDSLYNLYSGVYDGYNKEYYGYYNFYNFGVSDSCVQEYGTTFCGLDYAKKEFKDKNGNVTKKPWNSVQEAIKGGMDQIARHYVGNNQYTIYYQKFNVIGSNRFNHQYQTNIVGPSSESVTTFKAYENLGIINANFKFEIPLYLEMNATIDNSAGGAVDDKDNQSNPSSMAISTIITSSGYRYSSKYISNIAPGTDVNTIKSTIEAVGGNSTVTIMDKEGNEVKDGQIGTGYKVSIKNQDSTEILDVVIKGDTSGDGKIDALDLLQVQKNILGAYNLEGAYNAAGDTSGDGKIDALDLLQVQKSILGAYDINQ